MPRGDTKEQLLALSRKLAKQMDAIAISAPVAYVYNPLTYADALVRGYIETYGQGPKEVLLLGMNPGPFGMGQTGVPFGEVSFVRDYLQITGEVRAPKREHPKRKVLGLACPRSEVSGKRLWGAISAAHPNPKTFFARAFVANYCPLLFLSESGSNVTPDKITKAERQQIEEACDEHLAAMVEVLGVRVAVGVGGYAEKRLRTVLGDDFAVSSIPHPSPASPQANRGWTGLAQAALAQAGIDGLL